MYQRELQFVLPEVRTNVGTVFGGAGIIYAGLAAIMALLLWIRPPAPGFPANVAPPSQMPSLIFLNVVGATGGGGGGGDRSRALLPLKTSPVPAVAPPLPPVTIVPPKFSVPVRGMPRADNSGTSPSVDCQAKSPLLRSMAVSFPHGGLIAG